MSINSAMIAGVAGLQANSSALAAISNDIANVNTIGYKRDGVDFETLVTASTGDANFSAGGVTTVNQQFVTQQGSTTQTSSPTDLAIAGQGMFVTNTVPNAVGPNGQVLFTRAGSFTPDSSGYLKNTAGLYLMGWAADAQGNISPATNMSSLTPININTLTGAVSATSNASVNANLDATQTISPQAIAAGAVPVGAGAYDPLTNSMTAYSASGGTGVKPDFSVQLPISDSLGGQHTIQIDMLRSTTPNQWYAEIQAVPASDVVSGASFAPGQMATGMVAFNPDGSLDMTKTTLFGSPANPTLAIGASAAAAPAATGVNWAKSLGVAAQNVTIGIGGTTGAGALTQFASPSVVQQITTNGTPFGNVSSVGVDQNGFVTATFDNGTSRKIAQVAMATFSNADGLTAVSGNAYEASNTSGAVSLKTAGAGGAGTIASSELESSTVDLSAEFTNLIITQRAYTASSKIITTADQMTQDLLAIIR
jgi:flagellar hook protein FlgE